MSSFEEYIASLKRKNQNLHNENTNLWAEVKRLTDELDREKLNKNREFFAKMRAENARKNLEELFKKKSAETESLRADLEAKVVENEILKDKNENELKINELAFCRDIPKKLKKNPESRGFAKNPGDFQKIPKKSRRSENRKKNKIF